MLAAYAVALAICTVYVWHSPRERPLMVAADIVGVAGMSLFYILLWLWRYRRRRSRMNPPISSVRNNHRPARPRSFTSKNIPK